MCIRDSCRRGGASAAFDRLNKYFTISSMPVVSSQYWNQVHGFMPEDVRKDGEGLQTMRTLGENMAWLLKCIEAGREMCIRDRPGRCFPQGDAARCEAKSRVSQRQDVYKRQGHGWI